MNSIYPRSKPGRWKSSHKGLSRPGRRWSGSPGCFRWWWCWQCWWWGPLWLQWWCFWRPDLLDQAHNCDEEPEMNGRSRCRTHCTLSKTWWIHWLWWWSSLAKKIDLTDHHCKSELVCSRGGGGRGPMVFPLKNSSSGSSCQNPWKLELEMLQPLAINTGKLGEKGSEIPPARILGKTIVHFKWKKHYCLFKKVSFCRLFKDFGSSLMTWWLGCSSSHGPQTAPTKYESVWDVYSEDFRSETLMMKVILMDVDLEVCNRLCELEMKWYFHSMNVVGDKYRVTDT